MEQRDTEPPTGHRTKRAAEQGTLSWALSDESEVTRQRSSRREANRASKAGKA